MSGRKVFFDLETTSLSREAQICAIGIVYRESDYSLYCRDKDFTQYLIPTCKISSGAARINGFTKKKDQLFLNQNRVLSAEHIAEGLKTFVNVLTNIAEGAEDQGILLVGKTLKFYGTHHVVGFFLYYYVTSIFLVPSARVTIICT
jgi:hypothetical protein